MGIVKLCCIKKNDHVFMDSCKQHHLNGGIISSDDISRVNMIETKREAEIIDIYGKIAEKVDGKKKLKKLIHEYKTSVREFFHLMGTVSYERSETCHELHHAYKIAYNRLLEYLADLEEAEIDED